ncbi:MAG: hypothetical protein WBD20_04425 [Pirellulaceae bacterium]
MTDDFDGTTGVDVKATNMMLSLNPLVFDGQRGVLPIVGLANASESLRRRLARVGKVH